MTGIADAVVVADGEGLAMRLVAYVVPAAGAAPTVNDLRSALHRRLPDPWSRPRSWCSTRSR